MINPAARRACERWKNPAKSASCYQFFDWSRVAKEEIMIIEWFSVSTFDCGASSFFCPRSYSGSSRARARKWLIYVSLHKSWIIILLCRFKLPRSLGDPFLSARLRQEISYASILELLLLPLFELLIQSSASQRGTESHLANLPIWPREGWEDVELFAGQFARPMTLIRTGDRPVFCRPRWIGEIAGKWRGIPVLTGSKSTSSSFFDWGRFRQFGYTQNWGLNFKVQCNLKVFNFI